MILITGGLGFIGTHTTRALLDLGESCVLVQRRPAVTPPAFAGEPVVVERADLTDERALLEIGERHKITGIVHLAGSIPWPPGAYEPLEGARKSLASLLNVFKAARAWQVARVGVASTIGVYRDVPAEGPLHEDVPLPMTVPHPIPGFKKIGELLTTYLDGVMDVEAVTYRVGAIWGPLGHNPSPFFAAPQLVHAAARGTTPGAAQWHAGDGIDLLYAKDCGRAIALLQLADRLRHRTYNVGSGRTTAHGEVAAALADLVPGFDAGLAPGRSPGGRDAWLDISRLRADTGFEPRYDTARGVADYLAWLRAGHDR